MADEHFSHEVVERFFRSELSRGENRDFVRHLLKQCHRCSRLLRDVAQVRRLRFLVRGLEDTASQPGPDPHQKIFDRVLHLVGRGEARPVRGKRTVRVGLR